MNNRTGSDAEFDSSGLLVFLWLWRKHLGIVTVSAAALSVLVAFIITPKFRSTVILFPATTSSVSKALLSENATGKEDLMTFGEEEHAEQMLQVLNSYEIRDRIIEKYDLMRHYDIEPDEKYRYTKLIEEFEDNITFKRTEFQSVRIDVLDISPDTASMIANDIAGLVDSVMNRMLKERAEKALRVVENEYNELVARIKEMDDSLTVLRKLGVLDFETQIEKLTEQYGTALVARNHEAARTLEEKLNRLSQYGSAFVALRDLLEEDRKKLSMIYAKYKEAKVDANPQIPHKFVVNRAFPAEKKSYPVRWLVVVLSTLSAFLLAVLTIIALDNFRKVIAKSA